MRSILLRNVGWIYSCDDADTIVENGYVLLSDKLIVEIGREPCPLPAADASYDLAGCIVLPGLINLHHHFYQSLTRAVPLTQRALALDWLYGLYPLWAELDEEALYWGTVVASAELLLSGATTSVDHSYLLPADAGDLVGTQVRAAGEVGIRLELVRGCLPTLEADLAQRLAPLMGDRLERIVDREDRLLPALEAAIRRHHDTSRHAMTRIALGPTGVTYAKPELMRRIAELAAAHHCGLHTHFHPRSVERHLSLTHTGKRPIEFLRESGWLRPGAIYVHGTELDDEEIGAFAAHGCGIAHCPRTVIRVGYTMPRIAELRRRGVKIGIGVDGSSSNDGGAMLNDVRLAHLLHRANSRPDADPLAEWMTPYDTLLMATRIGADILGRKDIGQLAPGMAADVVAFDLRRVAYVGAVTDPLGALLLAGSDPTPRLSIVNGRVVVENGRLLTFDENRLIEQGNRIAARLVEAAERRTGLSFRSRPSRRPPADRATSRARPVEP